MQDWDVVVPNLGQDVTLVQKSPELVRAETLATQHLHSDHIPRRLVRGLLDLAEGPLADRTAQVVLRVEVCVFDAHAPAQHGDFAVLPPELVGARRIPRQAVVEVGHDAIPGRTVGVRCPLLLCVVVVHSGVKELMSAEVRLLVVLQGPHALRPLLRLEGLRRDGPLLSVRDSHRLVSAPPRRQPSAEVHRSGLGRARVIPEVFQGVRNSQRVHRPSRVVRVVRLALRPCAGEEHTPPRCRFP